MILIVLMVFSITSEIVLNAMIQPTASFLIQWLDPETSPEDASPFLSVLDSVMGFVATLSAPVNTASQTLLVWIGILGSALAFRHRAHLGVDALVRLYPPKVRLFFDYLSTALVGLFSLTVLVIGGYQVSYRAFSLGSKMPGLESLNRGWFYLVLIMTGLLNLIYCFYHFAHPKPVGALDEESKDRKD